MVSYRVILAWLKYFAPSNIGLAIKILKHLLIISEADIHRGYKQALNKVTGWQPAASQRAARWFFCGYASHAHESGPEMLRKFAEANRLTKKTDAGLFITPRDIPSLQLKSEDTIIFVDDLSGSGQQVLNGWQTMNELIASDAKAHLILTAVTDRALRLIAQNTRLNVIAQYVIPNKGNVFHDSCTFLAKNEKLALLKYCEKADSKVPRGYGDCGLLLVLSHKTPNNSIPILHVYHKEWHGLFPRYLPTN